MNNRFYPYLNDKEFLKKIDGQRVQTRYSRITALTWKEKSITEIQGMVTSGNVSINNSSSTRRTANISIFVDDENFNVLDADNLLSINKKIKLEIGIKNTTDEYTNYDVLWFPLGIYVIISPSISRGDNGTTISLQLQDKMCLLNGTCGGIIPASTQFDEYDTYDENGETIVEKPTIYQIIQEAVCHFGGEQLSKIVVSDIDEKVKRIMRWTSSSPLYVYKNGDEWVVSLEKSSAAETVKYDYGEDVGYIYTDFTYPTELIINAGGKVTDVLDSIVKALGNFEYFYDLDGNFVFQEIKNYLNTTESTSILEKLKNNNYAIDRTGGKAVYSFGQSTPLIVSYSNSPNYSNIKNDFIIWGKRKSQDGAETLIRFHLALDEKPEIGNTYQVITTEDDSTQLSKIVKAFKETEVNSLNYKNPDSSLLYKYKDKYYKWVINKGVGSYVQISDDNVKTITTNDWRTELYLQGVIAAPRGLDSNYYYTELANEWPKIIDLEKGDVPFNEVLNGTTNLDFFLDFVDSQDNISKFNVENIGRRTLVVNDENINCIFSRDIPDIVLIEAGQEDTAELRQQAIENGQDFYQIDSSIYQYLENGGSQNSAFDYARDLLYQHTNYNESITIQSVPIYHLDVNTRINVEDKRSNIHGDYIIQTISVPLEIGGTMSITASKALQKI